MSRCLTPWPCVRRALWFAWWMCLVAGVPAAMAQTSPNLWSMQLDAGLFAPIEARGASPMFGARYCKHYNSRVQGGLLTGIGLDSRKLEAPVDGLESRGSVELARIDTRLVPLMGFMQVDFNERAWLVPFVGFGAGYEWLLLDVEDHQTGLKSSTMYGNVAWETYAGVGLRLTGRVRVNGEVFFHGASLERRVSDPSGSTWREAVDVDGVGVRVGIDSIFE